MLGEEVYQQAFSMTLRGVGLSGNLLKYVIRAWNQHNTNKTLHRPGEHTIKQLSHFGEKLECADLRSEDVQPFKDVLKQYGVEFAILQAPPVVQENGKSEELYNVWFKAKEAEQVSKAFSAYETKMFEPKKPKIAERISQAKSRAAEVLSRPSPKKDIDKEKTIGKEYGR